MTTKVDVQKVQIDGKTYVPEDAVVPPSGKRAVVVVDRGWIFAGDVTETDGGRILLTRAVWVFSWEGIGFAGVLADPKSSKADVRKLAHVVDIPMDSEVFRIPVSDTWGL